MPSIMTALLAQKVNVLVYLTNIIIDLAPRDIRGREEERNWFSHCFQQLRSYCGEKVAEIA